jgi:hypothetical protein
MPPLSKRLVEEGAAIIAFKVRRDAGMTYAETGEEEEKRPTEGGLRLTTWSLLWQLVEGGVFQEAGITELLRAPGQIPGNSGTRYADCPSACIHSVKHPYG